MKRLSILFLLGLLCSPLARSIAQEVRSFKEQGITLSDGEKRYNEFSFDVDQMMLRRHFENPIFEHLVANKDSVKNPIFEASQIASRRSFVRINSSYGALSHDYNILEGNEFFNFSIDGAGSMSLKEHGTLYGHIQYSSGEDRGISWNNMRHLELFAPYIKCDSVGAGGAMSYDLYSMTGGYAFNLGRLYLGAEGQFIGEQSHRMTDPRIKNITSWVQAKVGAAYVAPRFSAGLWAEYERDKQYSSVYYWRPGQQDKYFVAYGLGLYDIKNSTVTFGYSRMYYVDALNVGANLTASLNESTTLSANLKYSLSDMSVEESSIKDLYYSKTSTLNPSLELKHRGGSHFSSALFAEYSQSVRRGYENIFESYIVDDVNNVYDFRIIAVYQNYVARDNSAIAQYKPEYELNRRSVISAMIGGYYYNRIEENTSWHLKVQNEWVEPQLGVGYSFRGRRADFDGSLIYSRKVALNNIYDVPVSAANGAYFLDFQHAFVPYAALANEYNALKVSATYSHHFSKYSVGVRVEGLLRSGQRNTDAIFEKDIELQSSAPLISTTPDLYHEHWGRASLFLRF